MFPATIFCNLFRSAHDFGRKHPDAVWRKRTVFRVDDAIRFENPGFHCFYGPRATYRSYNLQRTVATLTPLELIWLTGSAFLHDTLSGAYLSLSNPFPSIFPSKDTLLAFRRSAVTSDTTLFDTADLKSLLVRSKRADIVERLWDEASDHQEDVEDERSFVRFNGISYSFNFRLGEGATSHVMAATTDNRTQVAIKVFSKHQMLYYRRDAQDIINEKNIMDLASDVPFVAHLLTSFQDDERVYFVMPMYPTSLRMVLRRLHATNTQLELSDIRLFAAQLLLALIGLHNHKPKAIAHRDIKLDNILIDESGVCLVDFGFAKMSEAKTKALHAIDKFKAYQVVGTEAYLAPELRDSDQCKKQGYLLGPADIWMLGLVLYEMFAPRSDEFPLDVDGNVWDVQAANLIRQYDCVPLLKDIQMLHMEPTMRPTARDIQHHSFFADIDFNAVQSGDVRASYRPGPQDLDVAAPSTSVSFGTWISTEVALELEDICTTEMSKQLLDAGIKESPSSPLAVSSQL
ncbi:kinase-like domain-containing protein [Mycena floridula]|nr:kinase-like domain-containing protein [Mycena floridula]